MTLRLSTCRASSPTGKSTGGTTVAAVPVESDLSRDRRKLPSPDGASRTFTQDEKGQKADKQATSKTVEGDGGFQDSFQDTEVHAYAEPFVGFGDATYRPHGAVGGRRVKLP